VARAGATHVRTSPGVEAGAGTATEPAAPPLVVSADASPPAPREPAEATVTELLSRARELDQKAWDQIVERYTALLWSVARAYRLGTADAADVVQTTWLRLLENLGRIQDPERLAGWLATTARRESLRTLRRAGRERVGGLADAGGEEVETVRSTDPPVDEGLLLEERDALLWRCFRKLSSRCQILLRVLVATPPPSYADVSAALGMPVGSIGPTRGRCVQRLRALASEAGLLDEERGLDS